MPSFDRSQTRMKTKRKTKAAAKKVTMSDNDDGYSVLPGQPTATL